MERTMTIKKFFAPSTTRLGRQQWFRDVWQRLTVVLMLVMLTTATAWAQEPPMTVTAENVTVTYDGNGHYITVNVSVPESGATITYCETENGTYTDTNPTYTNAGVNTVYYKVTASGYADYSGSATVTINKAPLTITANNKSINYGDLPANNGVTYSGFVNGENENNLVGTLTYAYSYSQYGDVGNAYAITPSGLTSSNYEISFVDGTLTVIAKALTVTADNITIDHGAAAPAYTYTVTGLVNGESLTTEPTLSSTYTQGAAIGTYPISISGAAASANYTISYTPGTLTVQSKKYTVTFQNEDGTQLQSSEVEWGETPAYTGETPTKDATAQYTYTFAGWTPEIVAVTEDATYTATYSSTLRTNGYCGTDDPKTTDVDESETVTWNYDTDTKAITIAGSGPMMYYNSVQNGENWNNDAPWRAFAGEIEHVIIENGITYVGSNTFAHCPNISSVTLPTDQHFYEIGPGAFGDCTSLTSIDIPMSVNKINDGAFAGCSNLASVTLGYGDGATFTIGTDVFPATTTIIVPLAALQSYYNATSWASYKAQIVAGLCGKTESDHVTWTLTRLPTGYEVATAWEDVEPYNPTATTTVPAYKLTISGTGAMADYDGEGVTTPWAAADFHFPTGEWQDSYSDKSVITELEIGAGITALGANAFTGLRNLTSLTIADGSALTTIAPEDFAFPKTTLTLPDEVTTIDLKNDPATLRWLIDSEIWRAYRDRFSTVGGYCGTTANNADGKNLEWTLTASAEPDSKGFYPFTLTITGEGAMADYGMSNDTQAPWGNYANVLSLPDGLTTIGNYAFYWCGLSGTLDIPASVTSIGNFAFYHCVLTAVNIPGAKDTEGNALTTIGSSAFQFCESLATVTLGDGIKTIEGGAFQSTCLTAVTIPASVERIGYVAFATDESLKTVTMLGDNPPTLGESTYGSGPFPSSTSLSVILVPNETAYAAYMSAPTWNGTATDNGYNKNDYTHLLAPATITLGGNTSGWSTYCHKYIVSYQVEDGAAYTVSSVSDNTVQTAAAEHVAPYMPTLVYKENGGDVTLTAIAETATQYVPDNYNATTGLVTQSESNFNMLGNATDATITEGGFTEQPFYSLYNGKFYRYEGTQAIAAHRCILTVSPVYTAPVLTIGTETTSLSPVPSPSREGSSQRWYTLDGRKLNGKPTQKGIYVNGGRKVVVK